MCTPLLIAGIALTAGSIVTNQVASKKVENARSEVLHAETKRQQQFDREISDLNTQSQDRYIDFQGQQDTRAEGLADMFASEVGDANTASIIPVSSSDIVNQETGQQMANAQQYVDQQSGALADLRSFGDLLGEKSILQARDAAEAGTLGGFKIGSQNVVPYELEEAAKAGDKLKLFGDILRMGGTTITGAGIGQGQEAPKPMPRPGWLDYRPTTPTYS